MDLTQKDQLIKHLKEYGLWAKKSLGQNFLVDHEALDKIVAAAELSNSDTVLEIGPGVGALTQELVQRAGRVIAVEKDEKLAGLLNDEDRMSPSPRVPSGNDEKNHKFQIINGDALVFDPTTYELQPKSWKLVANIPYYITSKILEKFLSAENKPSLIVLLVQKEVAERICAKPGDLSVLAVSVQYYGDPEIVDIVPRDSFFPAPEVDSAILRISKIKNQKSKIEEEGFFRIVKAGFAARRKTLFNNLKSGTNLSDEQIEDVINELGLDKNTRAQELSVYQWEELVQIISAI